MGGEESLLQRLGAVGRHVGRRGKRARQQVGNFHDLDQVLGVSFLAPSSGTPLGTSTKATTLLGEATYALGPEWAASGRAGFINTTYVSNPRRDDAWTFGTTVTYSVWRNFGLTFDYQHIELSSNVAFQGFSRDVVTLGATYKY